MSSGIQIRRKNTEDNMVPLGLKFMMHHLWDDFMIMMHLQILKEWMAEGTARTYVEDSTDVQAAWNSLTTNFEGEDAISTIVQRARKAIQDAHFTQNTNNSTFQDSCTKHIKSNNKLDRYNTNVDGASQVT
mmetsp:Transcript_38879/g.90455  ORF Transcript_38879/g.90455 Transcript_38879/m.90455 type:complete len:131 (-) Transcript_38879:149-541(-)